MVWNFKDLEIAEKNIFSPKAHFIFIDRLNLYLVLEEREKLDSGWSSLMDLVFYKQIKLHAIIESVRKDSIKSFDEAANHILLWEDICILTREDNIIAKAKELGGRHKNNSVHYRTISLEEYLSVKPK